MLQQGVHSGLASGVVASSFRILRAPLSRLEDERMGEILPPAFHADIPPERVTQAAIAARALGESVWPKFPFVAGMEPISQDGAELLLNQAWRPALAVTGLEGAPPLGGAGDVLRPFLHLVMVKGVTVAMAEVLAAQVGQTTRMQEAA